MQLIQYPLSTKSHKKEAGPLRESQLSFSTRLQLGSLATHLYHDSHAAEPLSALRRRPANSKEVVVSALNGLQFLLGCQGIHGMLLLFRNAGGAKNIGVEPGHLGNVCMFATSGTDLVFLHR